MKNVDIKDLPVKKASFAVLDFETTGTSAKADKAIEIGIVKVKDLKITETYRSFINPGRPIPYFISKLTGISNEDVSDAPDFEDIVLEIRNFIGEDIIVAHNASFDYSFLKYEFESAGMEAPNNDLLCTVKLSKKLYPELTSHKLSSLTTHFKILHKGVHRALGDATVTAKLFIKMINQMQEDNEITTVSELMGFYAAPRTVFRIIKKKLIEDYSLVPANPGVYFFRNAKNEIVYIGKAKDLRKRIKNYFVNTAPRKAKEISRRSSHLGFIETNSELTALLTESELIKLHKPRFNTLLKKYTQQYFIRINLNSAFPSVEAASEFDFDGCDYFGPYTNRVTVNSLVEIIDKTFKLRECTEKEFSKKKKCYLADIERCLAPCINEEINGSYKEEIDKAYEFLSGQNQTAVDRLLYKMKEYSANQKYEEAAAIRDLVNLLLNQINKTSILSEPINKAAVLIIINDTTKKDYILLNEGKIFIKDFHLNKKELLDDLIADYYSGSIQLFEEVSKKDLELIKISLSWLVKHRNSVLIHYLKKYSSAQDLFSHINSPRRDFIKTSDAITIEEFAE